MSASDPAIKIVVAMDFSDDIITQIGDLSPRLQVTRHFPDVPDSAWQDAEVVYTVRHLPSPDNAPHLRWIQLHSAGVEHFLAQPITQADNVVVTSASGIHATQIANYCLMMILAFHYRLPKMLAFQHERQWAHDKHEIFAPSEMRGQTLGLVGYGSIARETARVAAALGMTVLASKRDAMHSDEGQRAYRAAETGDPDGTIPERIYPGEALASMVAECDYVVVTVPLTEKTRHMVDQRVFDAMKESAVLINIARGEVVDEQALINSLSHGSIRGAALDVFETEPLPDDSPLWAMDHVIISPHVSGNTRAYHDKAAALFMANIKRYLENKTLYNVINHDLGY